MSGLGGGHPRADQQGADLEAVPVRAGHQQAQDQLLCLHQVWGHTKSSQVYRYIWRRI